MKEKISNSFFNFKGILKKIEYPCVMGVLNLTNDSFYSGSRISNEKELLCKAEQMLADGASILDIGAVSSRPGANLSNETNELKKIIPAIKSLRKTFPDVIISVDTYRAKVAKNAINEGADIINDISGGSFEQNFFETIAELKVPYVLMHIQGKPQNMQDNPIYDNIIHNINFYFAQKIKKLNEHGVYDIIIDPGFGFGKTLEHNYCLLNNLQLFHIHNCPILIGISRKAMIYKVLNCNPEDALYGSLFAYSIALMKGVSILRVHDVKATVNIIKICYYLATKTQSH